MSTVDVISHTAPAIMLIEAIAREAETDDIFEVFGFPRVPLQHHIAEVKLTINGREVDFVKTAQEMWDRLEKNFDDAVEKKAMEIVSASRVDKIQDILRRFEYELESEVTRVIKLQKKVRNENL